MKFELKDLLKGVAVAFLVGVAVTLCLVPVLVGAPALAGPFMLASLVFSTAANVIIWVL